MKFGMAMAAAKLVAVTVLLQLSLAIAISPGHEARVPVAKPVLRSIEPGPEDTKSLVSHGKKTSRRQGLRDEVPEQIETWVDSGYAVQSLLTSDYVQKLTAGITAKAFELQLHELIDPSEPTRMVNTAGNTLAAANIKAAFEKLGLHAELQPLGFSPSLSQYVSPIAQQSLAGNVIGYLRGTDRADELVIVACHYDSVNWRNLNGAAPGVDDNGSGAALMLLLAKAFSQSGTKPRRSLVFVAFQAEEEGLVGSKKFASLFTSGGTGRQRFGQPVAAIVADEVAWPGQTADQRKVIFETKGRGKGTDIVVDTLAHASRQQCSSGFLKSDCVNGFVVNYHGFGSDHIPLLDVGIPAVLLIERDNMYHADKWGHSAEDTFKHIDPSFGAATTRLALEAVAALANPK